MPIAGDRELAASGRNARDIPGRIPAIEILGQRIGVVERQYTGQKVGEIVGSVKLPTRDVQVA
jgi:hypothetical protein